MPCSPVHAFAHPLFTMMARAVPPDRTRCSRETRTGAAWARFVVKTAAARAAVELVLKQLKENPPAKHKKPAYPDYHRGKELSRDGKGGGEKKGG